MKELLREEIILDLQMPRMDGFAVIETLRKDGYRSLHLIVSIPIFYPMKKSIEKWKCSFVRLLWNFRLSNAGD